MLKIMVVEKVESRRADLVDAICEVPGVVACGSASGFMDALRILSQGPMDAVVVGALPEAELKQLNEMARRLLSCDVLVVGDAAELVTRVESLLVRHRGKPPESLTSRVARAEALALSRAGGAALAHRLRVAQHDRGSPARRGMQTIVLQDWLRTTCAELGAMMNEHVELVPIIAADTPPVRCVPEVLEYELFDIVLDAAAKLPWGGTIWLTVERAGDDKVRIEVLESGLGTGGDVTLRADAPDAPLERREYEH